MSMPTVATFASIGKVADAARRELAALADEMGGVAYSVEISDMPNHVEIVIDLRF